MITLNQPSFQDRYIHTLKCKKPIGSFVERDQNYTTTMMPCRGRIYKPDRDANGKYVDIVGEPDNRIMVMCSEGYCIATVDELNVAFDEV